MTIHGIFGPASRRRHLVALLGLAACAGCGQAFAFDTTVGGWEVNLDTTLSSSVDLRTSPIDYGHVGIANGGKVGVANFDNGDLNYRDGSPVAAVQRITTELQVKRDDYGLFVRATGFYDPVVDSENTDFQPLTRAAERDIGADLRLLDAYAFARPSIFGHAFDVRVGAQALNWGESTFIPFGINSITPVDATALRTPGAELRQGFLPIPAVDVKTNLAPGLTLEGFWQFAWKRTRIEPDGSFFSTNDTVSDGGSYANLFYNVPDRASSIYAINAGGGNLFGAALPRSLDRQPTSLDEFGFALRETVASLNDAEFGLYFENYHSRTPFGSFIAGRYNISGLAPYFGPTFAELPRPFQLALGGSPGLATKTYTSTASYFDDYPKDIHLVGVSWNFAGPAGVAIQGELSSRLNQPIELSPSDLAFITNYPAVKQSAGLSPVLASTIAQYLANPVAQVTGLPGYGQIVTGWKRFPVIQAQSTATKLFGAIPSLSINSLALVGEIGFDYVANFPRERGILDAAYTTEVNSAFSKAATVDGNLPLTTKGEATQFSGAYTVAMIVDMPSVLPYGIDMKPTISVQHDFVGTSPVGVNVFQENTAAASLGVTFNYLQAWSLGVQYTNHFPVFDGGKYYGLIDRDFVSAVASYEF